MLTVLLRAALCYLGMDDVSESHQVRLVYPSMFAEFCGSTANRSILSYHTSSVAHLLGGQIVAISIDEYHSTLKIPSVPLFLSGCLPNQTQEPS